jgi:pimeloyl-ACP methyl ester carboxylesterase
MTIPLLFIAAACAYLLLTLWLTYHLQHVPREPVVDPPDWGKVTDTRIPALGGGTLELWRVDPDGETRGIVILAHGWGRNRDRMVHRARVFGSLGFTTVLHSARDHGGSSPRRFMNAVRFAEDIESVMVWLGRPVLLYGHSIGAAAAVIAAGRNPGLVQALFLEGCYAETKKGLRSLYRDYNLVFGVLLGPMIVFWMDLFYGFRMDAVSPARLVKTLRMPALIVHGEQDTSFPPAHALRLQESFPPGTAELFVAPGADHHSASLAPAYPQAIKDFVDRRLPRFPSLGGRG